MKGVTTIKKFLKVILTFILIVIVFICGGEILKKEYNKQLIKKYGNETENISEENLKIINKVISLAKEKEEVKISSVSYFKKGQAYRPISYINKIKG